MIITIVMNPKMIKTGVYGFNNDKCKSESVKLPRSKKGTSNVSLCVKMANMGIKWKMTMLQEKKRSHISVYIKVKNIENMRMMRLIV